MSMSDEAVRHMVMSRAHGEPRPTARRLRGLDPDRAMRLLSTVEFGRIVFTAKALPAIRPVNHLVDNGAIIVRTHLGAAVTASVGRLGTVVAYQADRIDERTRLGWSVVVTGYAVSVADPAQIARFEQLLQPWVDMPMNTVIRIQPQIVNGFLLCDTDL